MEEGICTTSAPSGDDMFVLGHVENTQTNKYFILLLNFLCASASGNYQHSFLYKNKNQNNLYTVYTIRHPPLGSELEIWLEELAIHGCI